MESLDRVLYHTNPIMDLKRSSSYSYLSETSFFPSEVKSCKSEVLPDLYGSCRKQAASSPFEIFMPVEFQTTKSLDHLEPRHDQAAANVNIDLAAARTSNGTTQSHSLRPLDGNPGAKTGMNAIHALCFAKENGVSTKIPPFENSLFSSSLPVLYSRKVEISSRNTHIDHSLDTAPRDNYEEEQFTSLEEIEAQTIGNLLPDDDDLFGGVTDCVVQPNGGDMEELDLFYNVGGMDLEDCDFSRGQKYIKSVTSGSTGGKQPTSKKEINQGILIVSNVDSSVSNDNLRSLFCIYGDIKEIQSVPRSNHQKLIEYFDTRAAEAALHALDGSKIAGKQIKLEPVTYGGIKDLLKHAIELQKSALQIPYLGSQLQNGISSTIPDSFPSLDNKTDHSTSQLKFDTWGSPNFHPHSLGDYHDGFMNGFQTSSNLSQKMHKFTSNGHSLEQGVLGSAVNGSLPLNGQESIWSNSCHTQPAGTMWPNSPSYMNGVHRSPSPMLLASNNHHVGSAPAVNPTIWDRHQQPYAVAGSPETSVFHPGSWGSTRISKTPMHSVDFVPHNMYPHVGGNCMDLPMPSTAVLGFHPSPHQRCMMFPGRGQRLPGLCSYDPPSERVRSRRSDGASNQASADKKQFELDIERIIRGEDSRTTLMIKNIPNKYTSKMLLAAIDENHRGTYDFIYLPIDFKNKCNVGYAFINMTDPSQIIPFYKAFNGKKWEKFNSEKVASLAYARIQGKTALISHFQNSSLMNEDKRCRPILFNTEGPNAGDQVPFPMGINGRSRAGKTRSVSLEEKNHQEAIQGDQSSC